MLAPALASGTINRNFCPTFLRRVPDVPVVSATFRDLHVANFLLQLGIAFLLRVVHRGVQSLGRHQLGVGSLLDYRSHI